MATTKKTTTSTVRTAKKTKAASTKATASRKKPAVKHVASKQSAPRSFRLSKAETPFMTFSPTRQTLYWIVLGIVVIVFALWISKLQADIQGIYDSIDLNTASQDTYTPVKKNS